MAGVLCDSADRPHFAHLLGVDSRTDRRVCSPMNSGNLTQLVRVFAKSFMGSASDVSQYLIDCFLPLWGELQVPLP